MWDLATIVRLNEQAHERFVQHRREAAQAVQKELARRELSGVPVTEGDAVLAVDYYQNRKYLGRIFLNATSFFSLR